MLIYTVEKIRDITRANREEGPRIVHQVGPGVRCTSVGGRPQIPLGTSTQNGYGRRWCPTVVKSDRNPSFRPPQAVKSEKGTLTLLAADYRQVTPKDGSQPFPVLTKPMRTSTSVLVRLDCSGPSPSVNEGGWKVLNGVVETLATGRGVTAAGKRWQDAFICMTAGSVVHVSPNGAAGIHDFILYNEGKEGHPPVIFSIEEWKRLEEEWANEADQESKAAASEESDSEEPAPVVAASEESASDGSDPEAAAPEGSGSEESDPVDAAPEGSDSEEPEGEGQAS